MKSFFEFLRDVFLDETYKWAIIIGLFIIGGAIINHYSEQDELKKLELEAKIKVEIKPTPPQILESDKK